MVAGAASRWREVVRRSQGASLFFSVGLCLGCNLLAIRIGSGDINCIDDVSETSYVLIFSIYSEFTVWPGCKVCSSYQYASVNIEPVARLGLQIVSSMFCSPAGGVSV